jgi:hypothetical protein
VAELHFSGLCLWVLVAELHFSGLCLWVLVAELHFDGLCFEWVSVVFVSSGFQWSTTFQWFLFLMGFNGRTTF